MFVSLFISEKGTSDYFVVVFMFFVFSIPLFFLVMKERKWRKEFQEYKNAQNQKRQNEFLKKNDFSIVWTVIGEKQIYTPMSNRDSFDGYMQISGYCHLDNDKINIGTTNVRITDDERGIVAVTLNEGRT